MAKSKIGKDVVGKVTPSKVELTLNLPPQIMQLKLTWEKQEKRTMSDEEFQIRFQKWLEEKETQRLAKIRQPRIPPDVARV
jgi:hypothetical protein